MNRRRRLYYLFNIFFFFSKKVYNLQCLKICSVCLGVRDFMRGKSIFHIFFFFFYFTFRLWYIITSSPLHSISLASTTLRVRTFFCWNRHFSMKMHWENSGEIYTAIMNSELFFFFHFLFHRRKNIYTYIYKMSWYNRMIFKFSEYEVEENKEK